LEFNNFLSTLSDYDKTNPFSFNLFKLEKFSVLLNLEPGKSPLWKIKQQQFLLGAKYKSNGQQNKINFTPICWTAKTWCKSKAVCQRSRGRILSC
jgi:hypothetical protein